MVTNVVRYSNDTRSSLISFNSENVANSFRVKPMDSLNTGGQWISAHKDRPLVLSTKKGVCEVWDADWKIFGKWEGETNETILLDGGDQGVGGEIQVSISGGGDIRMLKA